MAKIELDHPAIDQIETTPEIVHLVIVGLTEEEAKWKPALDRWSVAEVLEHLSHIEGHYFRAAIDRILSQEGAEIEPYDQNALALAGTYSNREPEESFAHWEEQREDNVAFLHELEPSAISRAGRHPVLGTVTINNLLNEWAIHDLEHVRQLAELVRAQLFYPELGPLQAQYKVNP